MDSFDISDACESVITSKSEADFIKLLDFIEEIPQKFAESEDSFLSKILSLKKMHLFEALRCIRSIKIKSPFQLKLIKFIDFLIATSSKKEEFNELFSDEFMQRIILYQYDIVQSDVLLSFSNLLKSISLKIENIDTNLLFTDMPFGFPLFSQSIQFLAFNDSIAVSSARFVLLHLCTSKEERIVDYINFHIPKMQIERIIASDDIENIDFIADLMNVSPPRLLSFIKTAYENKLMKSGDDPKQMTEAIQNFIDTPLKSVIMKVVNEKIVNYDYSNSLCLGLLLECLERKLILFETGATLGFISPSVIRSQKGNQKLERPQTTVCDLIKNIANAHENIVTLNLCLNIWEHSYPAPPPSIFDIQHCIVRSIRKTLCDSHILAFIQRTEKLPRTDLTYLKSLNGLEKENLQDPFVQVSHLTAVQLSLGRWTNTQFNTFAFPEMTETQNNEKFKTTSGEEIVVDIDSLIHKNIKHALMKVYAQQTKNKKIVELDFFDSNGKKFSQTKETNEIEFSSVGQAESFISYIRKNQMNIINVFLRGLGG